MAKTEIKYIENKSTGNGLSGQGVIGRVTFSKSGLTLRYKGVELQSLKGSGFKANYFDTETGDEYWVSNPRKDGNDTLYGGKIEIDSDVRSEYWIEIRGKPGCVTDAVTVSKGKA